MLRFGPQADSVVVETDADSADAFIERALRGTDNTRPGVLHAAKLKDEGVEFVFVIVPGSAHDRALADALAYNVKLGIPKELQYGFGEELPNLKAAARWFLLHEVMRRRGAQGRRLFRSVDHMRDVLTPEERDYAFAAYESFVESVNPLFTALPDDTLAAIDEAVKKKELAGLAAFGACSLASYMLTSDARRASSPTPSSSSGPESGAPLTSGPSTPTEAASLSRAIDEVR